VLITELGHETTSGTLSFLFYYLIKNPATYLAAQQEVDRVVGRSSVTVEHMSKLPFIEACIRETLRLKPPVSLISLQPLPETTEYPVIIGGKYEVHKGDVIIPILHKVQQDPVVYGEDGEQFRPERMLDEQFFKLPPNSWKVGLIRQTLCRAIADGLLALWEWRTSLHWAALCMARSYSLHGASPAKLQLPL